MNEVRQAAQYSTRVQYKYNGAYNTFTMTARIYGWCHARLKTKLFYLFILNIIAHYVRGKRNVIIAIWRTNRTYYGQGMDYKNINMCVHCRAIYIYMLACIFRSLPHTPSVLRAETSDIVVPLRSVD